MAETAVNAWSCGQDTLFDNPLTNNRVMDLSTSFWLDPHLWSHVWKSLQVTITLSAWASFFAVVLGFVCSFLSFFGGPLLKRLVQLYVTLFRNTPLLIQLYLYYRGFQSVGIALSPELCGIIALSLYTGAYLCEVFRAGFEALPAQQSEAALSLGLNRWQSYSLILLPQASKLFLPSLANYLISLVKNSSLVAFISVSDLFYLVYTGAVDQFRPIEFFVIGSILYGSLSLLISLTINGVEWLLGRQFKGLHGNSQRTLFEASS